MSNFIFDETYNLWIEENQKDFLYSDGKEKEDYIYNSILKSKDKSSSSTELESYIIDWPSEYHLTRVRKNLLIPFDFTDKKSVLDLGCGTGSLLRFWGEQGFEKVVGVEGSKDRAKTASARCRGLENVSVYVSNIMDFETNDKFDIVTLIGVLEYAPKFIKGEDPVGLLLKKASSFLSKNGILIVAIENKLGAKYIAGFPEDHTDKIYFGIQNLYAKDTAITYGKSELKEKLNENGFKNIHFYYPFPDYKIPQVMISEEGVSEKDFNVSDLLLNIEDRSYLRPVISSFDISLFYESLHLNKLVGEFSNSFLVFVSKEDLNLPKTNWLAKYYSNSKKRNQSEVAFYKEGEKIYVLKKDLTQNKEQAKEEYIKGESLLKKIKKAFLKDNNEEEVKSLFSKWIEFLKNKKNILGKIKDIDCIPQNIIVSNDNALTFIDEEEKIYNESLPFSFVVFRGILYTLHSIKNSRCFKDKNFKDMFFDIFEKNKLKINDEIVKEYLEQERSLQEKNKIKGDEEKIDIEKFLSSTLTTKKEAQEQENLIIQKENYINELRERIIDLENKLNSQNSQ